MMWDNRDNRAEQLVLPATDSNSGPAAFPLGSLQSRAAARRLIQAREDKEDSGTLFVVTRIGRSPNALSGIEKAPNSAVCTCKKPAAGTLGLCMCFW